LVRGRPRNIPDDLYLQPLDLELEQGQVPLFEKGDELVDLVIVDLGSHFSLFSPGRRLVVFVHLAFRFLSKLVLP
jgi:hypothetical protein